MKKKNFGYCSKSAQDKRAKENADAKEKSIEWKAKKIYEEREESGLPITMKAARRIAEELS